LGDNDTYECIHPSTHVLVMPREIAIQAVVYYHVFYKLLLYLVSLT